MKIYLTFLAVGCLGSDDISFHDIYKNIGKITSENGAGFRNNYGGLPLGILDGTSYKDTGVIFDEKISGDLIRGHQNDRYNIDDGNPDIHGRIERPCQVYDTFCIRKFFAEHSNCKISGRRLPEPLFRAQLNLNYAHVNISVTQRNVLYSGLSNGIIRDFYINKATDNLLISIDFPSINVLSNQTTLKFYLRGREPIVTSGFGDALILDFTATAVIPNLKNLRLDKAEITTYVNNPVLPFIVEPTLALSTDPEVLLMLTAFFASVPIDQQSAALTETNFYAFNFIQYNICDFGLHLL